MKSLGEMEDAIVGNYEGIEDNMMKYEQLIQEGNDLVPMPEMYRQDTYLIKGCQSKVWLAPELKDGHLYFYADSNAQITKGIISLLVKLLNGRTPDEIENYSFDIIHRLGLKGMLSSQRSNGLDSMINKLKYFAKNLR